MTLHVVGARQPEDLDRAFSEILKEQARAVVLLPDPMLFAQGTRIAALAARNLLPVVGEAREFAAAGGLMAYGPRVTENFRRAALYVDKVLKDAKPGDLPVEHPAIARAQGRRGDPVMDRRAFISAVSGAAGLSPDGSRPGAVEDSPHRRILGGPRSTIGSPARLLV